MIFYDRHTIEDAPWPDTPEGRRARSFLVPLFQQGAHAFFGDRSALRLLAFDNLLIPLSINSSEYDNSHLFSVHARYVDNLLAFLRAQPRSLATRFTTRALGALGVLLELTRINRVIQVDNWPSLRNLGSPLSPEQLRRLTDLLVAHYPEHAIVFPALSPATQAPLCNNLKAASYTFAYAAHTRLMLPYGVELSRKVRENRRRDARCLHAAGYRLIDGRARPGCAARLAELYMMLNRGKYSTNPCVSPAYFEAAAAGEMIELRLLEKDARIDAFYAFHVQRDVLFSPVAGYDLSLPRSLGLYSSLNSLLMQEAFDRGIAIETGGGADGFKSLRGDHPVPRYNAVHHAHLPLHRRAGWRLVEHLANEHLLPAVREYLRPSDPDALASFEDIPATFAPPVSSPEDAAARLEQALAAARRALDAAEASAPGELEAQLSELRRRLSDWPSPSKQLDPLHTRLAHLQRQAEEAKRSQRLTRRASRTELAQVLLQQAAPVGPALLVTAHLGDAAPEQARALADSLCKASDHVAVVLLATHGDARLLVTAAAPALLARGVDALQMLRGLSPGTPGAKQAGGRAAAWAEGSELDDITRVAEPARHYLQKRLSELATPLGTSESSQCRTLDEQARAERAAPHHPPHPSRP